MKLIDPSAELWEQPNNWHEQVARAARLCYGHTTGDKSAEDMCSLLITKGHNSMFRHGSIYFYIPYKGNERMPNKLYTQLMASPFVGILYKSKRDENGEQVHHYYISTNMQYIIDNSAVYLQLMAYQLPLSQFIDKIVSNGFTRALNLIRYTVCVTTQIGTSRELNRTSPNSIAEQSTRFVNFGKRGGVTIVKPYWWEYAGRLKRSLAKAGWKISEMLYNLWLRLGFPPEAARGFLMLEAGTRVVYTYNVYEWRHIMELRLLGLTGKPHPDAKISASLIHDVLLPAMRAHDTNAELTPTGKQSS